MSVTVKLTIVGDLYPAQRDVAERIIRAATEAAGVATASVRAWEIDQRRRRPFWGTDPFCEYPSEQRVEVEFLFHRDPNGGPHGE